MTLNSGFFVGVGTTTVATPSVVLQSSSRVASRCSSCFFTGMCRCREFLRRDARRRIANIVLKSPRGFSYIKGSCVGVETTGVVTIDFRTIGVASMGVRTTVIGCQRRVACRMLFWESLGVGRLRLISLLWSDWVRLG
jgi:hypothetical protein